MPSNTNLKLGSALNSSLKSVAIAGLAPGIIRLNTSSAQNVHKANEDSFSRSDKEDAGGEPPKEGSPPKEE